MGFTDLVERADVAVRAHLGGDITYTPSVGAPVQVRGVFDAAYVRVDLGQIGVSSSGPAVFLKRADLPSDPSDDAGARVTVKGVVYSIHEVQPDGEGGGVLLLLHVA